MYDPEDDAAAFDALYAAILKYRMRYSTPPAAISEAVAFLEHFGGDGASDGFFDWLHGGV